MHVKLSAVLLAALSGSAAAQVTLDFLGRYESGIFDDSAAEIVAHDPMTQRLFVTNAAANAVDVVCINNPFSPTLEFSIPLGSYGGGINSVSVHEGLVAVAIEAEVKQDPGVVVFFDAEGTELHTVTVGALPDMLTFSPDGAWVVVANEGEPNADYTVDPAGSIAIIPIPASLDDLPMVSASIAGFEAFDISGVGPDVRVFGPGATPSQDLEPEYVTISPDSTTAYVVCQENNALAAVDIASATVVDLVGLGAKDHSLPGNGLDASNRDSAINIANWPVFGLYQPDAIASYEVDGQVYIVSANEGDAREYEGTPGYVEEDRIADVTLDPVAFPDAATLQLDENLGRLKLTLADGDTDGDGDYDRLFSFGARSISIWDGNGNLVWDSGDQIEQQLAALIPDDFNSTNDENGSFDNRSDDKGPEPEALTIGSFGGRTYAFCGLERVGGVMIFDITDPTAPFFVDYSTSRDFAGDAAAGTAGDLGPEGLVVIEPEDSPTGDRLLVASHEVSGTTSVYRIDDGSASCFVEGDVNNDCTLNFFDVAEIVRSLGNCDSCNCPTDLDGDGDTDFQDLTFFINLL